MLLLEQDITRKERMNNENAAELYVGDKIGEYKVEAIWESEVYTKEADRHLSQLYYLVVWKSYPEEENTWEPFLAIMHLQKMINTFYKDHPKKPTAISPFLDSAPPMAKLTVNFPAKQKQRQLKKRATKRAKWGDKEESKLVWFSIEPKVAKRPKICFFSARSIRKPAFW